MMQLKLILIITIFFCTAHTADSDTKSKKRNRDTIEFEQSNKRHETTSVSMHESTTSTTSSLLQICNTINCQILSGDRKTRKNALNFFLFNACRQMAPLDSIKNLHENGANLHKKHMGKTCLHIAAKTNNRELVSFLLNQQTPVSPENNKNQTPLHLACKKGHRDIVQLLIGHNAKKNTVDYAGFSPLSYASLQGTTAIVSDLLLFGCYRKHRTNKSQSIFHLACLSGKLSLFKFLLQYKFPLFSIDNKGNEPLDLACKKGHYDIINFCFNKQLISEEKKHLLLHKAVRSENIDLIALILTQGAHIDHLNDNEKTPLHIACSKGKIKAARYLLEHGANQHKPNPDNFSPLHLACYSNHVEIIRMLIEEYNHEPTPRCMKLAYYGYDGSAGSPETKYSSSLGCLLLNSDKSAPDAPCVICKEQAVSPTATACCFSGIYCKECIKKVVEEKNPCPCCRNVHLTCNIVNITAAIDIYKKYSEHKPVQTVATPSNIN